MPTDTAAKRLSPVGSVRRRAVPRAGLAAALVLALALLPFPARGGHWRVAPDGSGDVPSIQDAVNRAAEGDTVTLAPGVYEEAVLVVDKSLLLRGEAGAAATILDPGYRFQALRVVRSGEPVTVQDVTFRRGRAGGVEFPEAAGGAILALVSPLRLLRCVFENNFAQGTGGAVYATLRPLPGIGAAPPTRNPADFRLYLEDCSFTGNRAGSEGGGVYSDDTVVAARAVAFTANLALNGGAAAFVSGAIDLEACRFEANAVDLDGGALRFNGRGPLSIRDGVFMGNRSERRGGAIRVEAAPEVELLRCAFLDNTSGGEGGGLSVRQSVLRVERVLLAGNAAPDRGGALHLEDNTSAGFQRCTWYGNLSDRGPSLSAIRSTATIDRSLLGDGSGGFACLLQATLDGACNVGPSLESGCLEVAAQGEAVPCQSDPLGLCLVPAPEECGIVGHVDAPCPEAGCATPVRPVTWGRLKREAGAGASADP